MFACHPSPLVTAELEISITANYHRQNT